MSKGLFVGLSTVDILYRMKSLPGPNAKVAADSQTVLAGGPAANAAITFAHLGGSATLVTALGRHPLAQVIARELRDFAIGTVDLSPDFDGIPPLSSVLIPADGNRSVVSANAASVPTAADRVDPAVLDSAAILLVDGHFMRTAIAWAGAARVRQIPVVLDGGSWKPGTAELLKAVDVAVCSADFRPPGCATEDETVEFLTQRGVPRIAITRGQRPIRYRENGVSGEVPVPAVTVVDTLGAGDVFHGAFCRFWLPGKAFPEALREAAGVAARSVQYAGARDWMQHGQ